MADGDAAVDLEERHTLVHGVRRGHVKKNAENAQVANQSAVES
ncbi:MAG TPA: hypothetical protein VMG39_16900 [Pseudolabrys sp.]|nr:hypothetical protein [Pseudolabrys sp.]